MSTDLNQKQVSIFHPVVIVAALGYFVDIYDLLLFSIVRKQSLTDLGYSGAALMDKGILLINFQMVGMLIGGILWGVLGDKKGRLWVLLGSIITYSLANIANGFVDTVEAYAFWRLIAGIGLAGELGAGITLVAEIMPKEKRGYATTVVASVGILGAVLAGVLADIFDWRTCYFIGGGLGLALLFLRIGVTESGLFAQTAKKQIIRGDFLALFRKKHLFLKYIRLILAGLPVWYVIGILITFSPEMQTALQVSGGPINAGTAVMCAYAGMSFGDICSGLISQYLKSRVRVLYLFWGLGLIACGIYFMVKGLNLFQFYVLCAYMGFSIGSWVIFMTSAAEQFGTNIRATVTTTVPNFIRGALVPLTFIFQYVAGGYGVQAGGIVAGVLSFGLALFAISQMKETFASDMDFEEY